MPFFTSWLGGKSYRSRQPIIIYKIIYKKTRYRKWYQESTRSLFKRDEPIIQNLFAICSDLFRRLFKFWDALFCMLPSNVEVFELLINPPSFPFVSSYSSRYKQNTFPFFARFGQSIHRAFQWFIFLANYLKFLLNSYSVAPGLVSTLKYETLFGRIVTIKLVFVII